MPHTPSAIAAALAGKLLGALVIGFIVTRITIRFTGCSRKGVIRTFMVGLLVTWGLRIAVWLGLDGGRGGILADLGIYAVAIAILLLRDYRRAEA